MGTLQRKQGLSVTNTLMMSSSGLSTELVSRSSLLGWLVLRRLLVRDLQSPLILLKSRLLTKRFFHSTKMLSTTSRFLPLLRQPLNSWPHTLKGVSDTWVKKVDTLVKEWVLLDNTVVELNSWVAKDKSAEGENQFSLEKMESTLGELKNIFKEKEKLVENL